LTSFLSDFPRGNDNRKKKLKFFSSFPAPIDNEIRSFSLQSHRYRGGGTLPVTSLLLLFGNKNSLKIPPPLPFPFVFKRRMEFLLPPLSCPRARAGDGDLTLFFSFSRYVYPHLPLLFPFPACPGVVTVWSNPSSFFSRPRRQLAQDEGAATFLFSSLSRSEQKKACHGTFSFFSFRRTPPASLPPPFPVTGRDGFDKQISPSPPFFFFAKRSVNSREKPFFPFLFFFPAYVNLIGR